MSKQRIVLVTGGGGFLGGAIVNMLVTQGECVRSFSRRPYSELERLGVSHSRGDLADEADVKRACEGVEGCLSCRRPSRSLGQIRRLL